MHWIRNTMLSVDGQLADSTEYIFDIIAIRIIYFTIRHYSNKVD